MPPSVSRICQLTTMSRRRTLEEQAELLILLKDRHRKPNQTPILMPGSEHTKGSEWKFKGLRVKVVDPHHKFPRVEYLSGKQKGVVIMVERTLLEKLT